VLPELRRGLEVSLFHRYTFSWVAHMREEARQTVAREADRPAIGHKTWQAENPDVLLGRTRPTFACHCSSPPACARTSALHLALCPSLSRVSPFTFVLIRAHLLAFHSHYFLTAHNTQALCFSKKFFESHFLLSCSPWNRLKSQVSCP
jgi:hypothetical protein